jgi:hypothetical protein
MGAVIGVCFKMSFGMCFPKCRKKCCKKKAVPIPIHQLAFMSTISEEFAYEKPQVIEAVYQKALNEGC